MAEEDDGLVQRLAKSLGELRITCSPGGATSGVEVTSLLSGQPT